MSGPVQSDVMHSCSACGASIYPEHMQSGLARFEAGRLLCHHCLSGESEASAAIPGLELASVDDEDLTAPPLALGALPGAVSPLAPADVKASRPGRGATRVKTFHAKLSEGAVHHMDELINAWLVQNPQVDVKFANTTVGIWEGKHAEPNLIITIFY